MWCVTASDLSWVCRGLGAMRLPGRKADQVSACYLHNAAFKIASFALAHCVWNCSGFDIGYEKYCHLLVSLSNLGASKSDRDTDDYQWLPNDMSECVSDWTLDCANLTVDTKSNCSARKISTCSVLLIKFRFSFIHTTHL